jgi:acyl-coenzyme A synthetase/AMP-(fatty) acid ligase
MHIADKIAFRAKLEPETPAIIAGDSVVTFGMLEGAVRAVAARLAAFNLPVGSIVGVSIRAPARHMAMTLALMRMGLCSAVFANETGLLNLPEVALAVADQPFALPGGKVCLLVTDDWFKPVTTPIEKRDIPETSPFRIVTSSGTTGRPKPLVLSYATWAWKLQIFEPQVTASGHWSRGMMMMDLHASWALLITTMALSRGQTMCFAANPAEALRMISLYGCQYLMGSVFHMRALIEQQRERFVPLPTLAGITTGGSVVTAQLLADMQATLARRIVLVYASTEVGCTAIELVGVDVPTDGGAGYLVPGVELEVRDEAGRVLGPDEDGEIFTRTLTPYTAKSADGAPILGDDNWFRPGDIGHLDANGRLYITGRVTEVINVGGGKIAPERVEQVLLAFPKVTDAGVVGVPDPAGGDAIFAAVVADETLDLAALSAFVAERFRVAPLARLVQVWQIPRGLTKKILRRELAELVREQR